MKSPRTQEGNRDLKLPGDIVTEDGSIWIRLTSTAGSAGSVLNRNRYAWCYCMTESSVSWFVQATYAYGSSDRCMRPWSDHLQPHVYDFDSEAIEAFKEARETKTP